MDFWQRLDVLRERHNVLAHPFYQRWSAGELSLGELADYAGEYHHAVVALADASRQAAERVDPTSEPQLRASLDRHAAEEESHIELWQGFTEAVGGTPASSPNRETRDCAAVWASDGSLLESLVGLYAVEAAQPTIAATKRQGLRAHYGISSAAGTAYFELHEELDVEHAAAARALISERLQPAEEERLLERAERVLAANWRLLDGVEQMAQAA